MASRKTSASGKTSRRGSASRRTVKSAAKRTAQKAPSSGGRSSASGAASARSAARAGSKKAVRPASKTAAKTAAKAPLQGVSLPAPAALGKRQLIEQVVARSGVKKKDAKPVVEAMLAVLGEAVASGRELNLQPFGKITIRRQNEKAAARVSVARIRQSNARAEKLAADPLAEAAE